MRGLCAAISSDGVISQYDDLNKYIAESRDLRDLPYQQSFLKMIQLFNLHEQKRKNQNLITNVKHLMSYL